MGPLTCFYLLLLERREEAQVSQLGVILQSPGTSHDMGKGELHVPADILELEVFGVKEKQRV